MTEGRNDGQTQNSIPPLKLRFAGGGGGNKRKLIDRVKVMIKIIIILFLDGTIFGISASLTYGPQHRHYSTIDAKQPWRNDITLT